MGQGPSRTDRFGQCNLHDEALPVEVPQEFSSSLVSPPNQRRTGHIEQQALRLGDGFEGDRRAAASGQQRYGGFQTHGRTEGLALPGQVLPGRAT